MAGNVESAVPTEALDLIAAAPDNSWVKLSSNTFESVWAPADLRQVYPYSGGAQADSPSRILGRWGSMGWDHNNHRLVVFGGGHANINLNEVYSWSAVTRQWSLSFASTAMAQVEATYPTYRPTDGNSSPVSSHTYGNNNYLPILNRFYTGGGASYNRAAALTVWDGNTRLRDSGGYSLDMTLAGQGYVASSTGSNIKYGTYATTDLPGANAWTMHDWGPSNAALFNTGPDGPSANQISRIEAGTAYAEEAGKDVLYWTGNQRLWKTVFTDSNPANDVVTQLSGLQNARESNGQIAYDLTRQLVLIPNGRDTSVRKFYFCDLKVTPDLDTGWQSITSLTGEGATGFLSDSGLTTSSGIAYDANLDKFVLWMKDRQPWLITPPAGNPTPTTGWTVTGPTMDTGTTCPPGGTLDLNDSGPVGKFKYASDLGCCVAIENIFDGNVWALKLAGWVDPRV